MAKITLNLISGRPIHQGVAMEGGKEKDLYRKACGIIEMDDSDFKKLGCWKNTNVRVTSKYGTVIVKAGDLPGTTPRCRFYPHGTLGEPVSQPKHVLLPVCPPSREHLLKWKSR